MPNDRYAKWLLCHMSFMPNGVMPNDLMPNGFMPNGPLPPKRVTFLVWQIDGQKRTTGEYQLNATFPKPKTSITYYGPNQDFELLGVLRIYNELLRMFRCILEIFRRNAVDYNVFKWDYGISL